MQVQKLKGFSKSVDEAMAMNTIPAKSAAAMVMDTIMTENAVAITMTGTIMQTRCSQAGDGRQPANIQRKSLILS